MEKQNTNKQHKPITFEEKGNTYEKVTIALPKPIVDFYRFIAHMEGHDLVESTIAFDLTRNLETDIKNRTPDDWMELFSLQPAIDTMALREELLTQKQAKTNT
ncbi:MAG: hypothetical protein NWF00_10945 [Candidatus Bathyarchaeota archaeon]|nr:hypothetical protein [Candidatus Bathyarchaeota archaeon]